MNLPRRIQKPAKRASRWRSQAHCNFVRSHACCVCCSTANIQAAHVRLGSNTGMGQKPDDWRVVSLCAGPNANFYAQLGCHDRQHIVGEETFWRSAKIDPVALAAEFAAKSPKSAEIRAIQRERENAGG